MVLLRVLALAIASGLAFETAEIATTHDDRRLSGCDEWFPKAKWTSEDGMLKVNGFPFHLRGTNWFGLETAAPLSNLLVGSPRMDTSRVREGHITLSEAIGNRIEIIAKQGFNAIRLPLAVNYWSDNYGTAIDASSGKSIMATLTTVLNQAALHGIVVMLDMHRVKSCCAAGEAYYMTNTWNPLDDWRSAWLNVLEKFGDHPAVFAIDLFNEPHGAANWAQGGPNDWFVAATNMIKTILAKRRKFEGLFFVEGVQLLADPTPMAAQAGSKYWFAENMNGVWRDPITAGGKRVVYSPHVYGPSAYMEPYFELSTFPHNLAAMWDAKWGWVEHRTGRAVVLGEWGGANTGKDAVWQGKVAEYLVSHCIDSFYWTLNCNSGEMGGWLNPNNVPNGGKLVHIRNAQPHPSRFNGDLNKGYCFHRGQFANPACARGTGPEPAPAPRPASASGHGTARPVQKPHPHAPTPKPALRHPTLKPSHAPTPKPALRHPTLKPSHAPTPKPALRHPTVHPTVKVPKKPSLRPTPRPSLRPTARGTPLQVQKPTAPLCSPVYEQCGGQLWSGPECCTKSICEVVNDFYSQCVLPA